MVFERVILNNNLKSLDAINHNMDYWITSITMSYHVDLQKSINFFLTQKIEFYISLMNELDKSMQMAGNKLPCTFNLVESKKQKNILTCNKLDEKHQVFFIPQHDFSPLFELRSEVLVEILNALILERPVILV